MLSLKNYVKHFMLGETAENEANKQGGGSGGNLILANVYLADKLGVEHLIYNKKVEGGKNSNPITRVVDDLQEKHDGELLVPEHSAISVEILATRSPNNVGAEQLQKLLTYCKRKSIKVSIVYSFSHPFSWDNKYNKEGLKNLNDKGVKLNVLSLQQCLNAALCDVGEMLETLDELQTCRGTINIDGSMMRRAMNMIKNALYVDGGGDNLANENARKLKEILGYKSELSNQAAAAAAAVKNTNSSAVMEPRTFSIATYRDYFLLQNSDEIYVKLKLTLSKVKTGCVQDEVICERSFCVSPPKPATTAASRYGGERRKPSATMRKEGENLKEQMWKLIGDNVTVSELSRHEEIVVDLQATVNEYPDRGDWYREFFALNEALNEKIMENGLDKMRVESTLRYATLNDGAATPTNDSKMKFECMHVRDILLDMLEDLEDELKYVGEAAQVSCEASAVASALGLLNRAITVENVDTGKRYSMNSKFDDQFSNGNNSHNNNSKSSS